MKEVIVDNIYWHRDYVKEHLRFVTTCRMPERLPHFIKIMAPANLEGDRLKRYVQSYLEMHYQGRVASLHIRK